MHLILEVWGYLSYSIQWPGNARKQGIGSKGFEQILPNTPVSSLNVLDLWAEFVLQNVRYLPYFSNVCIFLFQYRSFNMYRGYPWVCFVGMWYLTLIWPWPFQIKWPLWTVLQSGCYPWERGMTLQDAYVGEGVSLKTLTLWHLHRFLIFRMIHELSNFYVAITSVSSLVQIMVHYLIITESLPCFNSLRPSDAIWRQWSWTTLAQVMACCLTAPSHFLNQCWLIIRGVLWHTSESSFAGIAQGIDSGYEFEKYILKNIFKSPRGQWVNSLRPSDVYMGQ